MHDDLYVRRIMSLRQQLLEDGYEADHQSEEDLAAMLRHDVAEAILGIGQRVTMSPGTWDKRFVRSMVSAIAEDRPITPRQMVMVFRLRYIYRRQWPLQPGDLALAE